MEDDQDKIMKSINIMSVVIYSVVLVLGVLGNGVVIWATGFRMEKTVRTVWFLNLAVADFLLTAFLPLGITTRALGGRWPFGWFVCMMDIVVFYMNMHASILILVVISVDRCVSVMCPLWAKSHRTVRKASWVSVGVWLLALALSSPYVIFKEFHGVCWDYPDLPMVVTNAVVGFAVPFAAIVSCYSVIVYRLNSQSGTKSLLNIHSYKVIVTVIAVFFLCWAPYHVIWLMFAVNHPVSSGSTLDLVIRFGIPITYALALLNSCLNPLLYVFRDVFRSSFQKALENTFAEDQPPQIDTSADPAVTRKMIALSDTEETVRYTGQMIALSDTEETVRYTGQMIALSDTEETVRYTGQMIALSDTEETVRYTGP